MKHIAILVSLFFVLPNVSLAAGKKGPKPQLAAAGFASLPTQPSAPKAASITEAPVQKIDFPSNLPEVEIPSDKEVAMTCSTAYNSCMKAGSAFSTQCRVVREQCLNPTTN